MQLNRLQFKSRYAYRPIVRYDIFPGAVPKGNADALKARIIGKAETFEQLPLPEPAQAEEKTNIKNFSRTRNKRVRELVYVPYEESA